MVSLYPAMLKLEGVPCLVVGGGRVAVRKIASLLAHGAKVTVVALRFHPQVAEWVQAGTIVGYERGYEEKDGEGMRLVFAATDSREVNMRVWRDARRRGQWVNVASAPELSDFHVPASVRKGKLTIAVSTSGASPALAADIARRLSAQFGEEYERILDFLHELRQYLLQNVAERNKRRKMLKRMAQIDWHGIMRSGTFDFSVEEWAARLAREALDGSTQEGERSKE